MRIGIDIHGVLDHHPERFIKLAMAARKSNGVVHILTGPSSDKAAIELNRLAEEYNGGEVFWHMIHSIVDHVVDNDIPHVVKEDGHVWTMVHDDWNRVKGDISKELNLDLHFDDSKEYEPYFEPGVFCHVERRK